MNWAHALKGWRWVKEPAWFFRQKLVHNDFCVHGGSFNFFAFGPNIFLPVLSSLVLVEGCGFRGLDEIMTVVVSDSGIR